MPVLHANPGRFSWCSPDGRSKGHFNSTHQMKFHGRYKNPEEWGAEEVYAARLMIGLNVGTKPTWTVEDVVPIVQRVRLSQVEKAAASFVSQRGLYTQQMQDHPEIVNEDSVQVIIVDVLDTPPNEFRKQMVELAEVLADALRQKEIILEIQKNGVALRTSGISGHKPLVLKEDEK